MKPATPLPWFTSIDFSVRNASQAVVPDNLLLRADGDYIVHAANAYPQLVEMLYVLQGIASGLQLSSIDQTVVLAKCDALLRSLGEES